MIVYGEWDNNIENDATNWQNIQCAHAAWQRKRIIDNWWRIVGRRVWRRTWRSHWFKRALRIVYTADRAYNIVKWRLMCAPYNGTTVTFLQFFVRQIESFDFTSSVRSGGLSVRHSTIFCPIHRWNHLSSIDVKSSVNPRGTHLTSAGHLETMRVYVCVCVCVWYGYSAACRFEDLMQKVNQITHMYTPWLQK